jgi:hypothetical protein
MWKQQSRKEQHFLGSRTCKLDKVVVAPFFGHILQQFSREKNHQHIFLSLSCSYDIGQIGLLSCYGPSKVNMFLQRPGMVPKHQSPSTSCHVSYIKFRIEITSNQRLIKGLHCTDFFLQVGNQCIGQQPKTNWLVQNALIYHKQQHFSHYMSIAQVWPLSTNVCKCMSWRP